MVGAESALIYNAIVASQGSVDLHRYCLRVLTCIAIVMSHGSVALHQHCLRVLTCIAIVMSHGSVALHRYCYCEGAASPCGGAASVLFTWLPW